MVISPFCGLLEALGVTVFQPRAGHPLRFPNPELGLIMTKVSTFLALRILPKAVRICQSAPAVIVFEGLLGQGIALHTSSVCSRCFQGPWGSESFCPQHQDIRKLPLECVTLLCLLLLSCCYCHAPLGVSPWQPLTL